MSQLATLPKSGYIAAGVEWRGSLIIAERHIIGGA
jgi:hypothetical protein